MALPASPRESALRDYLFDNPHVLFERQVHSKAKEVCVEGKFVDLLFEVDGVTYIVELKRESITREAVGQVMEYYSRLRQLHPARTYRMVLAAPSIPKYRSVALEEFGIRCVEVSLPGSVDLSAPASTLYLSEEAIRVCRAFHRSTPLQDAESLPIESVQFEDILPPANGVSLRLSQRLLLDGIPAVQSAFSNYETMPVAMTRANPSDVLCLPAPSGMTYSHVGVWWAFAFGRSEQMPKNDTPNLSVNALPWGLDIAVNAELRTSQELMRRRIASSPQDFDALVQRHGHLEAQAWMKLEHQPRFYHWIPMLRMGVDQWSGRFLLDAIVDIERTYEEVRKNNIMHIREQRTALSERQHDHMLRTNKNANIALRLVQTLGANDDIWQLAYQEQRSRLNEEYVRLKPLIEFFN